MKKIAINGFGRIGRLVFRIIEELNDLEEEEDEGDFNLDNLSLLMIDSYGKEVLNSYLKRKRNATH